MRERLGVGEEREGGRLYVATPDAATPDPKFPPSLHLGEHARLRRLLCSLRSESGEEEKAEEKEAVDRTGEIAMPTAGSLPESTLNIRISD
ncbi:hypothetical protein PC9H_003692 [Pleurotus ostreatus]|uniref:Uncharacterized protein n=1 Tax=Pleurotus ostreatus TaxID=5322 RepID=A0A8H7A1Y0_PLEOS|nr:uncharacterized protein PC9H_003692 [Pleurotus ostreatus]KAF7436859.1 hypothetical protein PC9H_003692 [Pleurotus ostreatus]